MANAYTILKVSSDADLEEIEAAYDRLFDRYESKATLGDPQAVQALERLNDAFDTLSDPVRRAALDAELGATTGAVEATVRRPRPHPRPAQAQSRASTRIRASSQAARSGARTGGRSRVYQEARPIPITPLILLGLLGFALAAALTYYFVSTSGPSLPPENRGAVVATVNDQPIYEQDFLERAELDKNTALNDPIFGTYMQTLSPFSQTQALETFRSDSLDRLINFEVLIQQARKEGLYPEATAQQVSLIENAKSRELRGETFEQFLKTRNLTEGQYNRRVIRNVVYTVMADAHTPKTGTPDERRSAFFQWICQVRQSYVVKINITFTVANPPCTSDLPPELPLPGIDNLPEPEPTAVVPLTPQGPPAPP